jgi:hypothetical protein
VVDVQDDFSFFLDGLNKQGVPLGEAGGLGAVVGGSGVVPEPATLGLLLAGGSLTLLRPRRTARRRARRQAPAAAARPIG